MLSVLCWFERRHDVLLFCINFPTLASVLQTSRQEMHHAKFGGESFEIEVSEVPPPLMRAEAHAMAILRNIT